MFGLHVCEMEIGFFIIFNSPEKNEFKILIFLPLFFVYSCIYMHTFYVYFPSVYEYSRAFRNLLRKISKIK